MAKSNNEKRAAFVKSLKVDTSKQNQAAKRAQMKSNNQSNSSSQSSNPQRQRSLEKGRGNER